MYKFNKVVYFAENVCFTNEMAAKESNSPYKLGLIPIYEKPILSDKAKARRRKLF